MSIQQDKNSYHLKSIDTYCPVLQKIVTINIEDCFWQECNQASNSEQGWTETEIKTAFACECGNIVNLHNKLRHTSID